MGTFAQAVTRAAELGSDCWEWFYWKPGQDYILARRETYMHSRRIVQGPEFGDFIRFRLQMGGRIPLAEGVRSRNDIRGRPCTTRA